jgi:hypothetical protein
MIMARKLLGRMIFSCIAALLQSALICAVTTVYALPITVNVTIPRVKLIEGTETGADELYSKVNINNYGYQKSRTIGGVYDYDTIYPYWNFKKTIDPRILKNYNIPISIQLWDDDSCWPFSCDDDQIDINPYQGRTLNLFYNLERRVSSLSSPQTGNPPGDRATLYFNITSNQFQYIPDVDDNVTYLGPDRGWLYEYTLTNQSNSTFNIDYWYWSYPYRSFDLTLQPGETFSIDPFTSSSPPVFSDSFTVYDDLNHTTIRTHRILVPAQSPSPVPEPSSFVLFGIGLASLGLIGRRISA